MGSANTCRSCDAYHAITDNTGECRLRPPTIVVVTVNSIAQGMVQQPIVAFPALTADSWCAEHEPAEIQHAPH